MKKISCYFIILISSFFLFCPDIAWSADRFIKREVRGVWMATAYGIDWPNTTGYTASVRNAQKEEMIQYLDVLQKNNFNAVYFQVRTQSETQTTKKIYIR